MLKLINPQQNLLVSCNNDQRNGQEKLQYLIVVEIKKTQINHEI